MKLYAEGDMNRNLFFRAILALLFSAVTVCGCAGPRVTLFPDAADPLREFTLSGKDKGKLLVISVKGIIDDEPKKRLIRTEPSAVEEIVSQLRLAEEDEEIKAVMFKIDSPGGTATAADLLYHEIMAYKKRSGATIFAALMNVAASGGYYIALPADRIFAHPTSITGSVGVVFMRPKLDGLMEKIGVSVKVSKSGKNKDMGSPFRPETEEEEKILQDLTDRLAHRFVEKVRMHRPLDDQALSEIATARIYLAEDARALGLVDEIGYLSDALAAAKTLAGLAENARVIVYRRSQYANDTIYNPATSRQHSPDAPKLEIALPGASTKIRTGFYYLWPMAVGQE
ncbi:MAG: signal peptide peptidase SppA [Desulfobacterales bacterium]|nr:signal peptide peptidase SppA [Desulfobacterales bacterium]